MVPQNQILVAIIVLAMSVTIVAFINDNDPKPAVKPTYGPGITYPNGMDEGCGICGVIGKNSLQKLEKNTGMNASSFTEGSFFTVSDSNIIAKYEGKIYECNNSCGPSHSFLYYQD